MTFATQFQSTYSTPEYIELPLSELVEACSRASLSQFPVVETKVTTIVKSFAKGQPLLRMIELGQVLGEDTYEIIDGRHRVRAIQKFVSDYVINSMTGKIQLRPIDPTVAASTTQDIPAIVKVRRIIFPTRRTLNEYVIAANGSRSMTSAEKNTVALAAGTATPTQAFKQRVVVMLGEALNTALTPQTRLDIVTNIMTRVKGFRYANDEQLRAVCETVAEWFDENQLPGNIAREYKDVLEQIFTQEITDENGHDSYYQDYLNATLLVPAKKTKSAVVAGDAAATIAALQAQILALQAQVG